MVGGWGLTCSRHDVDVAPLVNPPGVTGVDPFAIEPLQVALVEPLFVFPECTEGGGSKGESQDDVAHLAALDLAAFVVDNPVAG